MSFPTTWYSQTSLPRAARSELNTHETCDVCIIGAGIAGLTAALELTRRGKHVVILEAHQVAWGASGRNGGVVSRVGLKGQGRSAKNLGWNRPGRCFKCRSKAWK